MGHHRRKCGCCCTPCCRGGFNNCGIGFNNCGCDIIWILLLLGIC
ncbi:MULTISPECIES: hypothetical protein [Clostridium]|nr:MULTISPECIES: hypothetical protein [Clostridium]